MSDPRAAPRAIDALRRGWPVRVDGPDGALVALAIETADPARLAEYDPDGRAEILLSHPRAAALRVAFATDATPARPALIARERWLALDDAMALADPSRDRLLSIDAPIRALPLGPIEAACGLMMLARLAGLLPAFFVMGDGPAEVTLDVADIATSQDVGRLAIAARARLPVAAAEQAEIVAFRAPDDINEHVALIVGEPDGRPPLVRLHSECLTGDVLGSLKCDCGPQLHAAIQAMAEAGWGILLYLRQEGRGIGLINKLRAYGLQDEGFDTVDANLRLGFAIDSRDFGVAARMLALLGQDRVRLLTNNPAKVAGLEATGVRVVARIPHAIAANPHNERYLEVKRDRTGHLL